MRKDTTLLEQRRAYIQQRISEAKKVEVEVKVKAEVRVRVRFG